MDSWSGQVNGDVATMSVFTVTPPVGRSGRGSGKHSHTPIRICLPCLLYLVEHVGRIYRRYMRFTNYHTNCLLRNASQAQMVYPAPIYTPINPPSEL
ncbi:hypothetical protein J6590_061677 [Homalodisca vitripennis]|nr:hypothetical protein J6590_061677 [Homalodisca vitripennis]